MKVLIDQAQITERLKQVSRQIEQDYRGKQLVIIMVLKGAICLVADLIRELKLPLTLEAVQCSSYKGASRGELTIFGLDRLNLKDKDILIVDDIFDSGHTMAGLYQAITDARSIRSCVLLRKKVSHITEMLPDYVFFEIENEFVVGYGLDYDEQYRNLPSICVLEGSL